MSRQRPLPIDDTIRMFVEKQLSPADRSNAVQQARQAVLEGNASKLLIAELAEEAVKQGMKAPTDFMGLTFTYGIAIGILAVQLAQNRRIITI
jgi:hypothetical protein